SGSEDSDGPWLARLLALARPAAPVAGGGGGGGGDAADAAVLAAFGLPSSDPAAARRALLLDLRNLGTLGLQQDSFPGLLWADARLAGPILAPIDASRPLDAQLPVRCADCHSGAPLDRLVPLASHAPPLGRCTHCHLTHPEPPSYASWGSIGALDAPAAAAPE